MGGVLVHSPVCDVGARFMGIYHSPHMDEWEQEVNKGIREEA